MQSEALDETTCCNGDEGDEDECGCQGVDGRATRSRVSKDGGNEPCRSGVAAVILRFGKKTARRVSKVLKMQGRPSQERRGEARQGKARGEDRARHGTGRWGKSAQIQG